jgi:membrane-associated protein
MTAALSDPSTLALGPSFLDPATLLSTFGLAGVLGAVFAETGLLVGFFLPGDSLLFTAGLFTAQPDPFAPLWVLLLLVPVAGIVGDQVGYLIGRRTGPALYSRPDSRLFKQRYVTQAHEFFEKHGSRTVLLARFVPVLRTFVPVLAGVSTMSYRRFTTYNVIGGIVWGAGVVTLGNLLGGVALVRDHVEVILVLIVALSLVPVAVELLRARRRTA